MYCMYMYIFSELRMKKVWSVGFHKQAMVPYLKCLRCVDSASLTLFPDFDCCLLLPRQVRQLWCWLWAMAEWTWCRHSWHRGRRSISRMTRAPQRWCVQASMAMLILLDYCWHSQTAMPPWLTVYVSHCCHSLQLVWAWWLQAVKLKHSNFVSHVVLQKQRVPFVKELPLNMSGKQRVRNCM